MERAGLSVVRDIRGLSSHCLTIFLLLASPAAGRRQLYLKPMARLLKDFEPLSQYKDRKFHGTIEEYIECLRQSKTVYVGNIAFHTTEEQIYDLFGRCGDIRKIIMGLDKNLMKPCGFCFVEYFTRREAEDCVKYLNGTALDERDIRIDFDWGFQEGRQYGRGKSGGQVRDEYRTDYDVGRGGFGKILGQARALYLRRCSLSLWRTSFLRHCSLASSASGKDSPRRVGRLRPGCCAGGATADRGHCGHGGSEAGPVRRRWRGGRWEAGEGRHVTRRPSYCRVTTYVPKGKDGALMLSHQPCSEALPGCHCVCCCD